MPHLARDHRHNTRGIVDVEHIKYHLICSCRVELNGIPHRRQFASRQTCRVVRMLAEPVVLCGGHQVEVFEFVHYLAGYFGVVHSGSPRA